MYNYTYIYRYIYICTIILKYICEIVWRIFIKVDKSYKVFVLFCHSEHMNQRKTDDCNKRIRMLRNDRQIINGNYNGERNATFFHPDIYLVTLHNNRYLKWIVVNLICKSIYYIDSNATESKAN